MRIPLDYYRILSVPVKATLEQLERAYSDRLLQQPRREYSASAIEARQELIKYSYQVLADSEQRASYDAQFLINMQPLTTSKGSEEGETEAPESIEEAEVTTIPLANPTIEISSGQLVGALLILHELGEYETVLELGINYYNRLELEPSDGQNEIDEIDEVSLDTTQEDLILSLALAYLEFGREQWHRQEYEKAALSGQMGIDLLEQKNLFSHIQAELERDLARLRPYRVLELISQNPTKSLERAAGFTLLQSMLLQREGIEGKGEDRSGLNFDQFLCFVQQLRTYLTSAEQQQLFDNESQSNSAIANYLAVYALLGRGFCHKQPELVLRAQRKLDTLSEKQDVSWEQAISALLLGHTEKAIYKLRNASDLTRLKQVEQHSQSNTDLLPGLCFYGEQWLQEDVVAQFVDLSSTPLTLKEYFADSQVQQYLEELAPGALTMDNSGLTTAKQKSAAQNQSAYGGRIRSLWRNIFSSAKPALAQTNSSQSVAAPSRLAGTAKKNYQVKTSRQTELRQTEPLGVNTVTIERDRTVAAPHQGNHTIAPPPNPHQQNSRPQKSLSLPLQPKNRAVPASVMRKAQGKAGKKPSSRQKSSPATVWKGWLFVLGLILGVGTLSNVAMKLFLTPNLKTANQAQLAIAISEPAVEIPAKKIEPIAAKPELTLPEQAQEVIQTWLTSKSAAFGQEHQIDQLNNILAEPLLTTWRERAVAYKSENLYREYQHQIKLRSATLDPKDRNKATVEAEVKEVAQHYQSGQLDNTQSYNDNLLVRYQLIRQGEKWLISNAEVLKTL